MEYSKVGRGGAILPFLVAAIIPKFLVKFRSRDHRYDYSFFRGSSGAQTWRIMHEICFGLKTNSQLGSTESRSNSNQTRFRYANSFYRKRFNGRESVSPLQVYEYAHARRRELIKKYSEVIRFTFSRWSALLSKGEIFIRSGKEIFRFGGSKRVWGIIRGSLILARDA